MKNLKLDEYYFSNFFYNIYNLLERSIRIILEILSALERLSSITILCLKDISEDEKR